MKIDIFFMFVNLTISSFHRLKVHMSFGFWDAMKDKKVFVIKLQKKIIYWKNLNCSGRAISYQNGQKVVVILPNAN